MQTAALPEYEEQRLEALHSLNLLDTPPEEAFDELARLVRSHFKTEMALIALVDKERVWFKSAIGIEVNEVLRDKSLCAHVILSDELTCIQDSLKDDRFFNDPPQYDGHDVRFYAGIPLSVQGGMHVGCLSVLGIEPREFSRQDYVDLQRFGRAVERLLAQSLYEQDQRFLVSQTMRLNTLLETVADGIVTIDAKGEIESINTAAATVFGYGREELLGVHFNTLMPDLGKGGWSGYEKLILNEDLEESDRTTLELQGRRKDGILFPMDLRIRDMWLDGQRLYTGIIRDITYEKSIQDEIRKGREILETTKDNIPIGITVFDEKGRLIVFNNSFSELLDLPKDLVSRGTSMYRILGHLINRGDLGDWENVRSRSELESLLKSGDKKHYILTKTNHKHIEISTRPMPGGGYVSLYSDLTLRLQYEERLEKALDEANRANEAKSNFLSTISHEIRTPLNGVIGVSQMLSDTDLTPEQAEKVDAILRSGKTLLELINDVLDMNKIESGNLEVENITFDLHDVFHSMESPFVLQAREKGIEFLSTLDETVPSLVVGDPVRLRQIVMNLIGNAIKFTAKGRVVLTVGKIEDKDAREGKLSIQITDTGIGIPVDRQETVFDSFSQADTSVSRKFGGTGLGLSIVRKLTELLGGEVSLSSKEGVGTTFTVSLPITLPTKEQKAKFLKKQQAKNIKISKSLKVLVAEDNEVNAMVTEAFLKDIGATSVIAENGLYAVDKFGEEIFDLVLMDIHMPEMDGIEATKLIRAREDGKNIPIIGLTAEAFNDRHVIFKDAGMDEVLTKPLTKSQLQQVILSYFEQDSNVADAVNADGVKSDKALQEQTEVVEEGIHPLFEATLKQPVGSDQKLDEYVDQLGPDVTLSLISKTPASIRAELDALKAAFEEQDASVIYRSIHTIAGVAASMCCDRLAQQASLMEKQADDLDLIAEMMESFLKTADASIEWWEGAVEKLTQ
ncbi:PAS domain S-box protein [Sneathiella sp. P13V-1]|uniref:ATP-binding protein n=1 Tax=Sneathiella sp. P13V-1 TaxID=2697366 RepID=UPI00187B2457|nr:ATP-binding protein [Sneathiella sp. P13V-1]MBE7638612.1 PAS domain S-box protein [Sneathiella sp. P13V-1]